MIDVLKRKLEFLTTLEIPYGLEMGRVGKVFYNGMKKTVSITDGEVLLESEIDFGDKNFIVSFQFLEKVKKLVLELNKVDDFKIEIEEGKLIWKINEFVLETSLEENNFSSEDQNLNINYSEEGKIVSIDEKFFEKLKLSSRSMINRDISYCGYFNILDDYLYTTNRKSAYKIKFNYGIENLGLISECMSFLNKVNFIKLILLENYIVFQSNENDKFLIPFKKSDFRQEWMKKIIEEFETKLKAEKTIKIDLSLLKEKIDVFSKFENIAENSIIIEKQKQKIKVIQEFSDSLGRCILNLDSKENKTDFKFRIILKNLMNGLLVSDYCIYDWEKSTIWFRNEVEDEDFICVVENL